LKLPAASFGLLGADSTLGNSIYFKFARCFSSITPESAAPIGDAGQRVASLTRFIHINFNITPNRRRANINQKDNSDHSYLFLNVLHSEVKIG